MEHAFVGTEVERCTAAAGRGIMAIEVGPVRRAGTDRSRRWLSPRSIEIVGCLRIQRRGINDVSQNRRSSSELAAVLEFLRLVSSQIRDGRRTADATS